VPPARRVVGNMVNTLGDRRHDCRAGDRLVYSPYNGDVNSPKKRPLCRRRHASCCCCTHYSQLVLYRGVVCVVWVNIMSAKNPKLSYSRQTRGTVFMAGRQHRCTSRCQTVVLHAVNFKQLPVRRRADGLGSSGRAAQH